MPGSDITAWPQVDHRWPVGGARPGTTDEGVESQDHVGGRTSQVQRAGFNLGSGALFLMGASTPGTNAVLEELGRYDELVPWDAKAQVIGDDGKRYTATFDQVASFLGMSVLRDREEIV